MTTPPTRMPSFYIPHGGGPCFFLNPDGTSPEMWQPMEHFLQGLIPSLPERPQAILIVSGHWEESAFTVHDGAHPGLLFDYYGFPEHTYRLRWDAPGAPELAHRAADLLREAGLPVAREGERGWDHGVFIPLKVAVPDADIPTAQISLRAGLDPEEHLALGRALAPLRDEGVLIVGSGMSFHNMRVRGEAATAGADVFDAALTEAVLATHRTDALAHWDQLANARFAHPREEHLIPLMVAAGAAEGEAASHVYQGHVMGWAISGYRFG